MSLFLQGNLLSRPHAKIPLSLFSLSLASKFSPPLSLSLLSSNALLSSPPIEREGGGRWPARCHCLWSRHGGGLESISADDMRAVAGVRRWPHVEGDGDRSQPESGGDGGPRPDLAVGAVLRQDQRGSGGRDGRRGGGG